MRGLVYEVDSVAQRYYKFRGPSLDDAYIGMRQKLGDDAVVIHTSSVSEGSVLGVFGKKLYEITAAIPAKAEAQPVAVPDTYASPPETPRPSSGVGSEDNVRDTVAYFRQLMHEADAKRNSKNGSPARDTHVDGNVAVDSILPFAPLRETAPDSTIEVTRELHEMRSALNVLIAETPGAGLPSEFSPHYRALLDRGLERERAAALIARVAQSGDVKILSDPPIFRARLKMEIRKDISVTGGIALRAGEGKVVALVGPTGVGKTTTLAKLAAHYAVRQRARVGVITTDTYRVAATDQLRVYANIIDIDMQVAAEPRDVSKALAALRGCDLVLMDTAGGSPFNDTQMTELCDLLHAAKPDETILLATGGTPLPDLREICSRFQRTKPDALLFTKLDETRRYGSMYSLAAETGLPLSYVSTGQNVPDDIQLANDGLIATLVVEGGDRRGTARSETS